MTLQFMLTIIFQVSGGVHRNGNIAGNGNSGSISPRSQGDTSRKRLSDQLDTCGKKRRVNDSEEQVHTVQHVSSFQKKLFKCANSLFCRQRIHH